MSEPLRVAICQPALIYGGRLRVILAMVAAWNDLGVVPDVITADLRVDPVRIADRYGLTIEANFKEVDRGVRLPSELAIVAFNRRLQRLEGRYDLLINTGNSLLGLPPDQRVLTYLFFPRRIRVQSSAVSIHQPEEPLRVLSRAGIERQIARVLYRRAKLHAGHEIVCMTQFTLEALHAGYGVTDTRPVVYPPVDFESYDATEPKHPQVSTMGRFVADKRQLAQIEAARGIPDMPFYIMGFAGNGEYLGQCQADLQRNDAPNVNLCPDTPFEEVQQILGASRYFLHTLVDEPFGLTAVEAIAAGCLPLVHDSGGQRETVPLPELRFNEFSEIPVKLRALEELTSDERSQKVEFLKSHARSRFSAAKFDEGIKEIFQKYM